MTQQHLAHAVFLNPGDAGRRVDFRRIVVGEEAIALDAPARHDDEDAKRRVGDGKARRLGLGERAGQEVDALDVAVDRRELALPLRIFGELLKARGHAHPQHAAERAIARHAALAIAQNVGGGEVGEDALFRLLGNLAQVRGEIVQRRQPGIARAQRVEDVLERHGTVHAGGSAGEQVGKRAGQHLLVVAVAPE